MTLCWTCCSDEEGGGEYGAGYLVEEHPEIFQGIRYGIGEFGAFAFSLGGRRFYPIMVAEKQVCHLRARVRGSGGHGSMPRSGGAMVRLAKLLRTLERHPLPVHITPVTSRMIGDISS